jgi:hypothetical protein
MRLVAAWAPVLPRAKLEFRMRSAMTGIIAAAGVACSAAWHPGMAVDGASPPRVLLARDAATETEALAAAEAAIWERLRERGRPEELDAFLTLFPKSRFAPEVRRRRDDLAATVGAPQPPAEEARPAQSARRQAPVPVDLAAAAGAAALAPDCGLLAAAADTTSITLAGVLRQGQETLVQGMLDAFGVPAEAVRMRLDPFEGPYCDALSAVVLNASTPPPHLPPRVALLGDRPLSEGERLRLRVEAPEWPAHLNVFFLSSSGEVASLVADPQPRPPGTSVVLEDPRWKIAAPFGTDLLLVIASELPLFERRRPVVEKLEDFTPSLASALQRARRAAARVAARALVVETAAAR